MIQLNCGNPFAKIIGGKYDGQWLGYSFDSRKNYRSFYTPMNILSEEGFFNFLPKEPDLNFESLRKIIVNKGEILEEETKNLYDYAEKLMKENNGREFIITDGYLQQIPNTNLDREQLYISAPTGSGKSWLAGSYMEEWKKAYPEWAKKTPGALVITPLLNDPIVEKFGLNVINVNEKDTEQIKTKSRKRKIEEMENDEEPKDYPYMLVTHPLTPQKMKNSCILFDDIQYITDKELKKSLQLFMKECQGIGRKEHVSIIVTSHIICDGWDTRLLLRESDWIISFINGGIATGIDYFMKNYMNLKDKKIIEKIKNLDSPWVAFHTKAPLMIFYKTGAFLL